MSVEKRLFLGIKQTRKETFLGLQDSEKVGYIWFVRCDEPVHFEIYLGTKKYGETNETVEQFIREIAEKLRVAIGLNEDLTLPEDFQYQDLIAALNDHGVRISEIEEKIVGLFKFKGVFDTLTELFNQGEQVDGYVYQVRYRDIEQNEEGELVPVIPPVLINSEFVWNGIEWVELGPIFDDRELKELEELIEVLDSLVSGLTNDLNEEIVNRELGDEELREALSAETVDRISGDTILEESINELSGRVDEIETELDGKQDKLTAGDNISIENTTINAIGYHFDETKGSFAEWGSFISWVESSQVMGYSAIINLTGEANSLTYRYDGDAQDVYAAEYLIDMVMNDYGYDVFLKISEERSAKLISMDTENKVFTMEKTLDPLNTLTNEIVLYYGGGERITNVAYGVNSHAEGQFSSAYGDYSHAEGGECVSYGNASHAEGSLTIASGSTSHAEGSVTRAYGYCSHTEGNSTNAVGENSHAEGNMTTASGLSSHAEGYETNAIGEGTHAEGNGTVANGKFSHVEGISDSVSFSSYVYNSEISEDGLYIDSPLFSSMTDEALTVFVGRTVSIGYDNTKIANITGIQENIDTGAKRLILSKSINDSGSVIPTNNLRILLGVANGVASHAEGSGTTASFNFSHAEGLMTSAGGMGAHAEGVGTQTINTGEHAEGSFNQTHPFTVSTIGIGTNNNNRKNAVEVLYTGDVYINGIGGYNGSEITVGTTKTLQNVIENIGDEISVTIQEVLDELNNED